MPSTYTSLLRLEKQAAGENDTTWGTKLNTVLDLVEDSTADIGAVTHSDAASYTLTTANSAVDEARMAGVTIGGAITAARNVVVPTANRAWQRVKNATTGGFALTVKTTAGTGIVVPNGKTTILACDATNVVNAIDYLDTLTVPDANFSIVDDADQTKIIKFQASGITTGTTRTLTVPDASGTLTLTSSKLSVFAATTSAELAGVISDETGSGALVFATSPTLVTPILGTPTSGTLTNCTGLPVSSGISGLAAGVATFLATPSSANLAAAVTDETGSGLLVFATSPTLITPTLGAATATSINGLTITASTGTLTVTNGKTLAVSNTLTFTGTDSSSVAFGAGGTVLYSGGALGTPSSGTLTNCTGLPISTGVSGLAAGIATFLATPSSANLIAAITDETGSGSLVFSASPTFTGTLTAATGSFSGNVAAGSNVYLQAAAGAPTAFIGSASSVQIFGGGVGTPYKGIVIGDATGYDFSLGSVSGGAFTKRFTVTDTGAVTMTGALTYGGVTLSNAVTGTGNMVLSASPTFTGTLTAATSSFSGHMTIEGVTSTGATGTGKFVFDTSPSLVTPALGTPTSGTLTNCTLPVGGITGLAAGVATFLATPSSANLIAAVTDETGTGALVFATSPTLVTPTLGVASATTINKVTITAPASAATLTLADGSSLVTSGANSLTLTTTGATNVTLPTSGTLVAKGTTVARSSNTILAVADYGKEIIATSTFTQTLTAAATLAAGWYIDYRNDGTGIITIDPNGAETIDGAATINLYPGEGCRIWCDGSAFTTVGRGTGLVLIQRQSVSGVAQVDFTIGIDSTFDEYVFELSDVTSSSAGSLMWMRGSTDGGSTFLSTNEYMYAYHGFGADLSTANNGGVNQAKIVMGSTLANGAGQHFGALVKLKAPSGTTRYKGVYAAASYFDNANNTYVTQTGGTIKTTSAINAIRFLASAGNLSGTFTLYGIRK